MSITLRSPAKINLFLRVLDRRSDGYHNLATLLQAIDFCDTLQFEINKKTNLYCDDHRIPVDGSNLIFKAIDIFQRQTRLQVDVQVQLTKKIPPQAGLGGGSSNAATTLWALNQLYDEPATLSELQQWGGEIGSDVPFFLSQGTAYCTGRGEKIEQLTPLPLPSAKLWIVKPSHGLSTPVIFKALKLETLENRDPKKALQALINGREEYFNDLEKVALTRLPQLALLKENMLTAGFRSVTMTGSGSALFCFGDATPPDFSADVEVFSACYLNRSQDEWYHLPAVMR